MGTLYTSVEKYKKYGPDYFNKAVRGAKYYIFNEFTVLDEVHI